MMRSGVIKGIDHVGIAVNDGAASTRWYIDHLAMEVVHDEQLPAIGVRLTYLRPAGFRQVAGTTMLQLVEPTGPGSVWEYLREHGEGLHHICFAVEDLTSALVNGAVSAGEIFRGGRQRHACFLSDRPNGTLLEFTDAEICHSFPPRHGM